MKTQIITSEPATFLFEDDGSIPNNPKLPLLFYTGAFDPDAVRDAAG